MGKRKRGKYKTLFENMGQRSALHKVIQDNTGKVVDYPTLLTNKKFVEKGLEIALNGHKGQRVYEKKVDRDKKHA